MERNIITQADVDRRREVVNGLYGDLSRSIAQMGCVCTDDDACEAHELLEQLVEHV